ncbi:MAG: GAF domain-containing protein [Bacteroidota bacterium]
MEKLYEDASSHALRMLEKGDNQRAILTYLAEAAESVSPGTVASIMIVDKGGLLRNGASPQLPADYLKAIDGIKPDPTVGTCAAAAATGSVVITEDFYADNKWSELRHLPMSLGFKGAWSMPIIDGGNQVLGTFGTYFTDKRAPSDEEINGVKLLATAAAMVISNSNNGSFKTAKEIH